MHVGRTCIHTVLGQPYIHRWTWHHHVVWHTRARVWPMHKYAVGMHNYACEASLTTQARAAGCRALGLVNEVG
jgi:hypothetical protein